MACISNKCWMADSISSRFLAFKETGHRTKLFRGLERNSKDRPSRTVLSTQLSVVVSSH